MLSSKVTVIGWISKVAGRKNCCWSGRRYVEWGLSSLDSIHVNGLRFFDIRKIFSRVNICYRTIRGVARGVYRYIYPPKSVNLTNFYAVIGCFFALWPRTNCCWFWNWNDLKFIPPQMRFLATPLRTVCLSYACIVSKLLSHYKAIIAAC